MDSSEIQVLLDPDSSVGPPVLGTSGWEQQGSFAQR